MGRTECPGFLGMVLAQKESNGRAASDPKVASRPGAQNLGVRPKQLRTTSENSPAERPVSLNLIQLTGDRRQGVRLETRQSVSVLRGRTPNFTSYRWAAAPVLTAVDVRRRRAFAPRSRLLGPVPKVERVTVEHQGSIRRLTSSAGGDPCGVGQPVRSQPALRMASPRQYMRVNHPPTRNRATLGLEERTGDHLVARRPSTQRQPRERAGKPSA